MLRFLGYKVELAAVGCCQRPRISHGFLRLAKTEGEETAKALDQLIQNGSTIVVCEPSCASGAITSTVNISSNAQLPAPTW